MRVLGLKFCRLAVALLAGLFLLAGTAQARPNDRPTHQQLRKHTQKSYQLPNYNPPNYNSRSHSISPKWAQRKISASDAKTAALERVPGAQVVDVKLEGEVYRVRLVQKDGRVIDVFVDAATGRVR